MFRKISIDWVSLFNWVRLNFKQVSLVNDQLSWFYESNSFNQLSTYSNKFDWSMSSFDQLSLFDQNWIHLIN